MPISKDTIEGYIALVNKQIAEWEEQGKRLELLRSTNVSPKDSEVAIALHIASLTWVRTILIELSKNV